MAHTSDSNEDCCYGKKSINIRGLAAVSCQPVIGHSLVTLGILVFAVFLCRRKCAALFSHPLLTRTFCTSETISRR